MNAGQKLVYAVFLALFFSAFVCTQSMTVAAADGVVREPAETNPRGTGDVTHDDLPLRTESLK